LTARKRRLAGAFTFKSKLVNECSKSLVVKEGLRSSRAARPRSRARAIHRGTGNRVERQSLRYFTYSCDNGTHRRGHLSSRLPTATVNPARENSADEIACRAIRGAIKGAVHCAASLEIVKGRILLLSVEISVKHTPPAYGAHGTAGVWRLVPFSLSFFIHSARRQRKGFI